MTDDFLLDYRNQRKCERICGAESVNNVLFISVGVRHLTESNFGDSVNHLEIGAVFFSNLGSCHFDA